MTRKEFNELSKRYLEGQATAEEEQMLKKAIENLNQDDRMVLILSKYQKLPYEEIGKIMDITTNNVKVKVFRAVKNLTSKFREIYKND